MLRTLYIANASKVPCVYRYIRTYVLWYEAVVSECFVYNDVWCVPLQFNMCLTPHPEPAEFVYTERTHLKKLKVMLYVS